MTAISVYSYGSLVMIPTMSRTPAGFYRLVEPVEVLRDPSTEDLTAALLRARARGNPRGPVSSPGAPKKQSILVRTSGATTEREFEALARVWNVDWSEDAIVLTPNRRASQSGYGAGFLEIPDAKVAFGCDHAHAASVWLLQQIAHGTESGGG